MRVENSSRFGHPASSCYYPAAPLELLESSARYWSLDTAFEYKDPRCEGYRSLHDYVIHCRADHPAALLEVLKSKCYSIVAGVLDADVDSLEPKVCELKDSSRLGTAL